MTVGVFDIYGAYIDYAWDFGLGLGAWQPTEERTVDLVQSYDGRRARSALEFDASGSTVTWKAQFVDGEGNDLDEYFSHEVTGARMQDF